MITDLMDRNINAYAERFTSQRRRDIGLPVQQMYGRVVGGDKFETLRRNIPAGTASATASIR